MLIESRILLSTFGAKGCFDECKEGDERVVDKAVVYATPNTYIFQQFDNKNNTKVNFML